MTRKPTATQRLDALLDDLRQVVTELRDKADSYLRSSKAYKSDERAALVRGAAVFRLSADKIEAIVGKHGEGNGAQAGEAGIESARAQGGGGQAGDAATHGPLADVTERADQVAGPVDVSSVWAGDADA